MSDSAYEKNSGGFTRIRAYIGHLLADSSPIDELSQKPKLDPAGQGLNRPYDLSELMRQTLV